MNGDTIMVLAFILCFIAGVCLVGVIERIKARRQYVKRLKTENQQLRRENSFLLLEIHTRGL